MSRKRSKDDLSALGLDDLAAGVARHHRAAEAASAKSLAEYREAGRYLLVVKGRLLRGEYQAWVEAYLDKFGMKDARRARELTQLAELSAEKWRHVATYSSPGYALKMANRARPDEPPKQPEWAPAAFEVVGGRELLGPEDRPPYVRPSMAEIAAGVRADGLTVASTFTGAGGACLGWEMAGCRVVVAVEFEPPAAETYRANFPDVPIIEKDVRDVTGGDLLAVAGLGEGELDLLDGGPPCAGFSAAGIGERGHGQERAYGSTRQVVDDLPLEFARLAAEAQPRVVVMENVPEFAKREGYREHFAALLKALDRAGYDVEARVLAAQWLGVPQARRRLIVVGLRRDLVDPGEGVTPSACFPVPLPYRYSLGDALAGAPEPDEAELADRAAASFAHLAIGEEWKGLTPGGSSPRYFSLTRPHPDDPCPTITQTGAKNVGAAGVTHPDEPRKFTPRELRAIFGFPDDFKLVGTFADRAERMGRAVPPPLMRAVANGVAGVLARSAAVAARDGASVGLPA